MTPHSKDIGRKPSRVWLDGNERTVVVQHADVNPGYVFTIQEGERVIYPMRRVTKIERLRDTEDSDVTGVTNESDESADDAHSGTPIDDGPYTSEERVDQLRTDARDAEVIE